MSMVMTDSSAVTGAFGAGYVTRFSNDGSRSPSVGQTAALGEPPAHAAKSIAQAAPSPTALAEGLKPPQHDPGRASPVSHGAPGGGCAASRTGDPLEPKPLKLSEQDLAKLRAGEPVYRHVSAHGGNKGVAAFRVQAPPEAVWAVITSFERYSEWVDGVRKSEVYRRDGNEVGVHFRVSKLGFGRTYFVEHHMPEGAHWCTWTLDPDKDSELAKSEGYWRVTPVEGCPGQSHVEYGLETELGGWVPGLIERQIVSTGLKQATGWVKVQAERLAGEE